MRVSTGVTRFSGVSEAADKQAFEQIDREFLRGTPLFAVRRLDLLEQRFELVDQRLVGQGQSPDLVLPGCAISASAPSRRAAGNDPAVIPVRAVGRAAVVMFGVRRKEQQVAGLQ